LPSCATHDVLRAGAAEAFGCCFVGLELWHTGLECNGFWGIRQGGGVED
jgi:hypothetical protein